MSNHYLAKWKNEKVTLGLRIFPDGKPKIKNWFFRKDNSWKNELIFVFNQLGEYQKAMSCDHYLFSKLQLLER